MAIDFSKLLSPEQRERVEARRRYHEQKIEEFKNMSNEDLANKAEYYITQSGGPSKWKEGDPVYDATVWHVILPELIKRIKERG